VPPGGGALNLLRALAAGLFTLSLGGCVQQAVLENDVRNAQWKARTLATATDPSLAQAALSAQLVELEALYQRNPSDARVLELLNHGYGLMARGFIELRRLDAVNAGDSGRARQEEQLRADAEARARYYRKGLAVDTASSRTKLESELAEPETACARRDRTSYEAQLNAILVKAEGAAEERLERALLRKLASAWLMPNVEARCKF
jgi:hypothetical protein